MPDDSIVLLWRSLRLLDLRLLAIYQEWNHDWGPLARSLQGFLKQCKQVEGQARGLAVVSWTHLTHQPVATASALEPYLVKVQQLLDRLGREVLERMTTVLDANLLNDQYASRDLQIEILGGLREIWKETGAVLTEYESRFKSQLPA